MQNTEWEVFLDVLSLYSYYNCKTKKIPAEIMISSLKGTMAQRSLLLVLSNEKKDYFTLKYYVVSIFLMICFKK